VISILLVVVWMINNGHFDESGYLVFDESVELVDEGSTVATFLVYLLLTYVYFRRESPDDIQVRAAVREERRRRSRLRRLIRFRGIWLATVIAVLAVYVAKAVLLRAATLAPHHAGQLTLLAAGDVVLTWFILHTAYAEHYATMYYRDGGGLGFPGEPEPDYLDFAYFAFSIGMTFGTTDVEVTSRRFRRAMLAHKLLSFGFNTAILALVFTILFQ
jgi:uncharacterized membrane protein